jgi:hypothetical protein
MIVLLAPSTWLPAPASAPAFLGLLELLPPIWEARLQLKTAALQHCTAELVVLAVLVVLVSRIRQGNGTAAKQLEKAVLGRFSALATEDAAILLSLLALAG